MHMNAPPVDDTRYDRCIIWVRDPVERFISSFAFIKAVILTNITGMTRVGQWCHLSSTCLVPDKVMTKVQTGHAYPAYVHIEELVLYVDTANNLGKVFASCGAADTTLPNKVLL